MNNVACVLYLQGFHGHFSQESQSEQDESEDVEDIHDFHNGGPFGRSGKESHQSEASKATVTKTIQNQSKQRDATQSNLTSIYSWHLAWNMSSESPLEEQDIPGASLCGGKPSEWKNE